MKKLCFLLLLALPTLAHAEPEQYQEISGFAGGLNSYDQPITLGDTEVQDALNVDFNLDGTVSKRTGNTLYASTTAVKYLHQWTYTDSSNTSWIITLASDSIRASAGDGKFNTIIATVPIPAVSKVSEVNALGLAVFVDATQGIYYWNGSSTSFVAGSPKGTLIAEYKGRVWVAGENSPNQNRLTSSEYLNVNNWTTGLLATSPVSYIVGLNDRSDGITALFSGGNDSLYIPKNRSINALNGTDQVDFQVSVLSTEAGCIDSGSMQSYANGLVCVSERGVELFDGLNFTPLAKKIQNKLDKVVVSNYNQQSWTQDTSVDFKTGTITNLSTSTVDGFLYLTTKADQTFLDTSTSTLEFNGGLFGSDIKVDDSLQAVTLGILGSSTNVQSQTSTSFDHAATTAISMTGNWVLLAADINYLSGDAGHATVPYDVVVRFCADAACATELARGTFTVTTNSTQLWYTAAFNNAVQVSSGTSYYLTTPGGSFSYWTSASGTSIGTYKLYARRYPSAATFVSRAYDVGFASTSFLWQWGTLSTTQVTHGQNISFTIATSTDNINWAAPISVSTGSSLEGVIPHNRYIKYNANFTSSNGNETPVLNDITIPISNTKSTTGSFKTAAHNIGAITSWSIFSVGDDVSSGGTIAYSICSSANSGMSPSACVTTPENSAITVATNSFIQVYSTFTITSATQNPHLDFFTVKWNSGDPKPGMASVVYKDRYFLAISSAGGSSSNDSVLVLSKTKQTTLIWTIYDWTVGGFSLYKGALYHADANATGNVYLDDQGYADNGSAINAYIKSKDYTIGNIINDKVFVKFWLVTSALGNYNITTNYYTDGDPTQFALDSVNTAEASGTIVTKLPFPIDSSHKLFGRTISFKFSNAENNAPFRVFGGVLSYKTRKAL